MTHNTSDLHQYSGDDFYQKMQIVRKFYVEIFLAVLALIGILIFSFVELKLVARLLYNDVPENITNLSFLFWAFNRHEIILTWVCIIGIDLGILKQFRTYKGKWKFVLIMSLIVVPMFIFHYFFVAKAQAEREHSLENKERIERKIDTLYDSDVVDNTEIQHLQEELQVAEEELIQKTIRQKKEKGKLLPWGVMSNMIVVNACILILLYFIKKFRYVLGIKQDIRRWKDNNSLMSGLAMSTAHHSDMSENEKVIKKSIQMVGGDTYLANLQQRMNHIRLKKMFVFWKGKQYDSEIDALQRTLDEAVEAINAL